MVKARNEIGALYCPQVVPTRGPRSAPTAETRCAGECGQPFTPGDAWWYHARLGVFVHPSCAQPGMLVCGEDISTHTVMWGTVAR